MRIESDAYMMRLTQRLEALPEIGRKKGLRLTPE